MRKYGFIIISTLLGVLIILAIPRKNDFDRSALEILGEIQNRTYIVSLSRYKELNAKAAQAINIVDLRDAGAYAAGHLPGAVHLFPGDHDARSLHRFMMSMEGPVFLYSDPTAHASEWWILLTQMGFEQVSVLETGPDLGGLLNDWDSQSGNHIMPDEIPAFSFVPDSSLRGR